MGLIKIMKKFLEHQLINQIILFLGFVLIFQVIPNIVFAGGCTETDNGKDKYVKGILTTGIKILEDQCMISREGVRTPVSSCFYGGDGLCLIQEYSCVDPNNSDGSFYTEVFGCSGDCVDGACINDGSRCGNHSVDSGEVCDGTNLNGKTCESKGYSSGTLKCSDNCKSFNIADCANSSSINSCTDSDGSDIKTSPYTKGYVTGKNANGVSYKYYDECSGSGLQINEMWCYEFGDGKEFGKLVYTCPNGCVDGACKKSDSSLCGNGIIDSGEVCDGENLNSKTCASANEGENGLKCSSDCQSFDKSNCLSTTENTKAKTVKDSNGDITLKLSRLISELEKKVINLERQLTKKINQALAKRLRGVILIQPESKGEVWFIHPETGERFYIKDGQAAYEILSGMGQGITAIDLEKVPLGYDERVNQGLVDTDGDKLPDVLEDAIGSDKTKTDTDGDGFSDLSEYQGGYKLTGVGRYALNNSFAAKLRGIYLDVDHRGSAWYIKNGLRYYISPENGYNVMRFLSLGVSNNDIRELSVGEVSEDDSVSQSEDDSNQNEDLI